MLEVVTCVTQMNLILILRVLMTVFHWSSYLMADVVVAVVAAAAVVVVENWLAVCCYSQYGYQLFVVNLVYWNLGCYECCLACFSCQSQLWTGRNYLG